MLAKIKSWMQQGTSILAASGAMGVITAWLLGQMNDKAAIAALVGCAVSFLLPQNNKAQVDAQELAGALVDRVAAGPRAKGGSPSTLGTTDPTKAPTGSPVAVEAAHL
jgi:hypothetical protein